MTEMTPERLRRVESLFHAALDRPPENRAAFLIESCGNDHALRHDVESLLAEAMSGDGFFGREVIVADTIAAHPPLVGRTLGAYSVQALLGAGGMGEVYRARDGKLGRDVAIKILPRSVTRDPERLARFEREARMLAALNHPNICAIYGLEEAEGVRFLVLELVDGETLAKKMRGQRAERFAPGEALAIARQIADALEAAHEKGIVHRDLKPANVTITHGGVVKVLDFGLAKPVTDAVGADITQSPTITQHGVTRDGAGVGVILGTAAYMSPEQARGRAVDKRTDIWAFGCVLFEMLAGRLAFEGETVSDTIGKILEREPDWSALPPATPPAVTRLLRRCLAKDPKLRVRDIGDVRIEIDAIENPPTDADPARPTAAPSRRAWMAWLAVAALAAGLAGTAAWNFKPSAPSPAVTRFSIAPPEAPPFAADRHVLALSPDGTQIVYYSVNRLFVRQMSQPDTRSVMPSGTMQPVEPAFSPDGRSIAFWADRSLKKVSVAGGAITTICQTPGPYGIDWSPDGIVVGLGSGGVLRVAPDSGSTPETIVRVKSGEIAQGPQLLPGGAHVLFTLATGTNRNRWDQAQIVVQSLKTGDRKTLIDGGSAARYLSTGHIVYAVGGILYAIAFDPQRLAVKGEAVPVLLGVSRSNGGITGAANYAVADNGTLAYIAGPVSPSLSQLAITDRNGAVELLSPSPGSYLFARVSPDGTRVAYGSEDGKDVTIFTRDLRPDGATQRLTSGGNNRYPVWTSKNQRIAFQSDRDGDVAIWQTSEAGGKAERLTRPAKGETHEPHSWSAASDTLLFTVAKDADVSLWTYSFATRKAAPFGEVHSSAFVVTDALFSPDGRWVAYTTSQSGKWTIEVQPFPATGATYPLVAKNQDDPHQPLWSPDGTELFFVPRPGAFEYASVGFRPLSLGNTKALPWWGNTGSRPFILGPPRSRRSFDMMPDGRFFGVILGAGGQSGAGPAPHIQVVLNWFEELKAITARGTPAR